jgi:hypothetical protein
VKLVELDKKDKLVELDKRVQLDQKVILDLREQRVILDLKVIKVAVEQPDRLEHKGHKVVLVIKGKKELMVLPDPRDRRVL